MNFKTSIVVPVLIGVTALCLLGYRLSAFTRIKDQYRIQASPQSKKADINSTRNKRNANAAHRFTELVHKKNTAESENPEDRTSGNTVTIWETRILDYARSHALKDVDATRVHKLAVKTADLFQMLNTASKRKEKGMEPYTGATGFTTMTQVITMEEEFREVIGVTFSDFMGTLDTSFIKEMANYQS